MTHVLVSSWLVAASHCNTRHRMHTLYLITTHKECDSCTCEFVTHFYESRMHTHRLTKSLWLIYIWVRDSCTREFVTHLHGNATHCNDPAHRGDHTEKYLDLQIIQFSVSSIEWLGLPLTPVKTCSKFWGLSWKLVWNFGSRDYFSLISSVREYYMGVWGGFG